MLLYVQVVGSACGATSGSVDPAYMGPRLSWLQLYCTQHLFWQLLQSTWYQMNWYYYSSGLHRLDWEGDSVIWAAQSLHRYAQASALDRTLQLCFGIGPTLYVTHEKLQ